MFFDRGSTLNLYLKVVNKDYEHIISTLYVFFLIDRWGGRRLVKAIGLDHLTEPSKQEDLTAVKEIFPELDLSDVTRPGATVDVLLGLESVSLHPVAIETRGELRLMESQFGTGRVLCGALPGSLSGQDITDSAHYLSRATLERPIVAQVSHVSNIFHTFLKWKKWEQIHLQHAFRARVVNSVNS